MLRPAVPLFISVSSEERITEISSAIEVALLVLNGSKDCPDHVLAEDRPMQDKDKWSAITLNISQTPHS